MTLPEGCVRLATEHLKGPVKSPVQIGEDGHDMYRWWPLAVLAVALAGSVWAQDAAVPDAAALYEDTRLLQTIRTLDLTPEQLELVGTLNARIRAERARLIALRAELWEEYHDDFEAVLHAWETGGRLDPRAQRAADNAIKRLQEAQADLAELEAESARTLLRELTDEQSALVQSAEAAQAQAARAARMAGFTSVGEYVAMELDAIRDLMADEYAAVAAAEARRIAANIVGPEAPAPTIDATAGVILQIMNQVRTWTPPVYTQQRETLPQQIEAALGVTSATPPVSHEDLLRLLRSERTPVVIALVTGSGGGEEQ